MAVSMHVNQRIDDFLNAIERVCAKYGMSISHQDSQTTALVIEKYKAENIRWLKGAIDGTEQEQQEQQEVLPLLSPPPPVKNAAKIAKVANLAAPHDSRLLSCGCAVSLRCRSCGECHRCAHDYEETSNGFAKCWCRDGTEKIVPPALVIEVSSSR